MLDKLKTWAKHHVQIKQYVVYFIRWVLFGYAIGLLGGLIGGGFGLAISKVTEFRMANGWMLYLMPLAGLLIVWLYRVTGEAQNRGTNMVLEAVSAKEEVTKATGPLILVSTIISHSVGASVGREGAALQIGGQLGRMVSLTLGRIPFLKLDDREKKIAVMAGMSAVFSALFGTPVAAAIFCMEVSSVGIMLLIEESLQGHVIWEGFFLKMLFTAVALSGGFKGGEIVPTLCVGACLGCAVGTLLGFAPGMMAACGMVDLFSAVTNCPIASIFIGIELFGGEVLPYFAVVVSLAYSLSGYYSLYGSQKFAYGKIRNVFLNRKAEQDEQADRDERDPFQGIVHEEFIMKKWMAEKKLL